MNRAEDTGTAKVLAAHAPKGADHQPAMQQHLQVDGCIPSPAVCPASLGERGPLSATQACVPPSSGPVTYGDGPGRAVPAELV